MAPRWSTHWSPSQLRRNHSRRRHEQDSSDEKQRCDLHLNPHVSISVHRFPNRCCLRHYRVCTVASRGIRPRGRSEVRRLDSTAPTPPDRRRQLLASTRSQERGTDVRDMGDGVIIECFGSTLSSRVLAPRPASSADESTGPAVGIPTPTQPTSSVCSTHLSTALHCCTRHHGDSTLQAESCSPTSAARPETRRRRRTHRRSSNSHRYARQQPLTTPRPTRRPHRRLAPRPHTPGSTTTTATSPHTPHESPPKSGLQSDTAPANKPPQHPHQPHPHPDLTDRPIVRMTGTPSTNGTSDPPQRTGTERITAGGNASSLAWGTVRSAV